VAWWTRGAYSVNGRVFDIGVTTVQALQQFRETGDDWTSGDPSPRASGNGSIMRLAPVLRVVERDLRRLGHQQGRQSVGQCRDRALQGLEVFGGADHAPIAAFGFDLLPP
jgi:ADP-ribosylglycohydrolase